MSMIAIIGFSMMILLVLLLLRNTYTPNFIFVILPTVAALLCGTTITQLGQFVTEGLKAILSTATLMIFAIIFFSIMKEAGVFRIIVNFVLGFLHNSVRSVLIITIIIAAICSLDGNAYATILVTIPAMLPMYDLMKIDLRALFLCIAIGVGATGITPWGGSLLRAVAVTHTDPIALYRSLIPIQGVIVILGLVAAHFLAKFEIKKGAGVTSGEFESFKRSNEGKYIKDQDKIIKQKRLLFYNFSLVIITIITLIVGKIPGCYLFMLAVAIALALNYPDAKVAQRKIKEYGITAMPVMVTFLSIGAFLGIMQGTQMFNEIVKAIVSLFPMSFSPHIYIVVAAFSVPLVIAMGSDAFYFALLPLVSGIGNQFGVSAHSVTYAFLITEQIGLLLSPAIPATYLGLGMLNINIGDHLRYSFLSVWGISVAVLAAAVATGFIPL